MWPSFAIYRGSLGSSCKSLSGRCYVHASQLSETELLLFIMLCKVQTPPSRNFHPMCKSGPQHGQRQRGALSSATGGSEVDWWTSPPARLTSLHGITGTQWYAGAACLQVDLSAHNQWGWPTSMEVKGAELSLRACAPPPRPPGRVRNFKGISMRSKNAFCLVGEEGGRNVTEELLCAGHYAPPIYVYVISIQHIHKRHTIM